MFDSRTLFFTASSATLNTACDKDGPQTSIALVLELTQHESVKTNSGEDLNRAEWTATLHGHYLDKEHEAHGVGIGVLACSEDHSSCFLQAAVGGEVFGQLISSLRAGRMPQRIAVGVKSLTSDNGNGNVWDLEAHSHLVVKNIAFTIPVGTEEFHTHGTKVRGALPVSSNDLEAFQTSLRRDLTEMTKGLGALLLVIAAIALIVGAKILLFR